MFSASEGGEKVILHPELNTKSSSRVRLRGRSLYRLIDNSGPVAELNRQIEELEQQILQRTRAKQDCDDLGQEVIRLREEKYQLQLEDATKESTRQKIAELEKAIAEIGGKVEEYEEALVRKLIERITVYDDYYTVEFKSGIEIDVRL